MTILTIDLIIIFTDYNTIMNPTSNLLKHALFDAGIKKPVDEQGKTIRTNSRRTRTPELSSTSDKLNGSAADEARKERRNSTNRGFLSCLMKLIINSFI